MRWTLKDGRLRLFLPNELGGRPALLQCNNVSHGALVVAGGRSSFAEFATFRDYCGAIDVEDEFAYDKFIVRADHAEGIRTVSVDDGRREICLAYDYQMNEVLERSVNGVEVDTPSTLSAIEFLRF